MSNLNLGLLKKNIYKTYFSDGIWDIVLGLIFLSFGLGTLVNQNFIAAIPFLLTVPFALKRSISAPRIGTLQFKQSQKTGLLVLYFLFAISTVGFVLGLGMINPSNNNVILWLTLNIFVIIGLILAIVLGLIARFFHFQRLYLYAILTFIGFVLIGKITSAGIVLTSLGSIITLIGVIVLRNFIKYHPKLSSLDHREPTGEK